MGIDVFLALLGFAFVTVITPGPNNLMLMASGANFGFQRSLPHMLGIGLGMPLMVVLVGIGIMRMFDAWPPAYTVLKAISVAYLLYLAWRIAHAAAPERVEATGRPLTFLEAAAFQWVNPKAWTMALSAITLYATGRDLASVLVVAGTYVLVSCVSTTTWTVLGQQMRRVLGSPRRLVRFNRVMALLLLATLIPVLLSGK